MSDPTVPDLTPIAQRIWEAKYRLTAIEGADEGASGDADIRGTWSRVAKALAAAEADPSLWEGRFYGALEDFAFLPAGRILAGAGTERQVTLFNCFVMGRIPDDMGGIFAQLREAALTLQQGGGIGYDFSTLRPKGALVRGVGADASGPVSFMEVWDAMCRTIMSAGARRGAMMATLRCDHPDIEAFIAAKRQAGKLTNFNLSVLASDAFLEAVEADRPWCLVFEGKTYKELSARALWDQIMQATYEASEPGVIFIDRINQFNNLAYCETIAATNPCGEQPLPPYGACLLGSINLERLVLEPFTSRARLDEARLESLVRLAVRMLDNAISVSRFPLEQQRAEAEAKRRIGLGITGLADALIYCGLRYGSAEAVARTESWMRRLRDCAYAASIALAEEKGAFPLFEAEAFLAAPGVAALPEGLRQGIAKAGIRNGLLTSIAPTGTISLLAGNVSSGLEPVFAFTYRRNILRPDGSRDSETVSDAAWRRFQAETQGRTEPSKAFVTAGELTPGEHLAMQAAVQGFVDASVSKTVNLPEDFAFADFKDLYRQAWKLGLKGCTTYRPSPLRGAVLESGPTVESPAPAATAESEAGAVVYMSQPLDRPEALKGQTYKLRWPDSDHALYITLNDIEQRGADGQLRRRPFEIFVNSKNMEHFAWTVALTRMISAVFRRGGDVSFVVEELKAVFDPRGGAWMAGRYVPSLLAAIGGVIEQHLQAIGFLSQPVELAAEVEPRRVAASRAPSGSETAKRPEQCPQCGEASLQRQEGCLTCSACGYSNCG
ncbi:MAG: adenosylcobalamin-dependent ribonucleoside-diphosphate reductase [Rhodospirillales bacterium]